MTPAGFPHSDIPGSKPVCGYPRLIAACHVLHRFSAPRHPPCTLSSLTKLEFFTSRRILSLLTRFSCQRAGPSSALPLRRRSLPTAFRGLSPAGDAPERSKELRGWWLGGADRNRTDDLRLARAALSQLSYSPVSAAAGQLAHFGGPR